MQFYYIIATVDQKLPQDHEQTDYKLLIENIPVLDAARTCEKRRTGF